MSVIVGFAEDDASWAKTSKSKELLRRLDMIKRVRTIFLKIRLPLIVGGYPRIIFMIILKVKTQWYIILLMRKIISSPKTFKVFSAFCTDFSVAFFLSAQFSRSIFDLTTRIISGIIFLYLAISFEHNS